MSVYDTRTRGAIFWIVIKMIHWVQEIPCIIGGNQKWTGAAPSFRNRAIKIIDLGLVENRVIEAAPAKIIADLRAWIKKYFKAASDE